LEPTRQAELMDDPGLPEADHLHALAALATINAVSGTGFQIARAALTLVPPAGSDPVRVVDLACGGGDVMLACGRRLARGLGGRGVIMTGVDISRRGLERAAARVAAAGEPRAGSSLRFNCVARDIVASGCLPCDIAICSLFLHHLHDEMAERVLRSMAMQCRLGFVVSDLIRSPLGLALAVIGTSLLSGSRVARVDGPLSVRAARTTAEYRQLLAAAGLASATVRRVWPERVLITWRRGPA
jgi:2-polyprenyl-3-methyl-5-hydroxy-6-metoxy-1,4-benzoquinol methylase